MFYRVAKIRKEMKPTLKTGHFHISKIQEKNTDLDSKEIFDLLNIVKKGIEEGIKGI